MPKPRILVCSGPRATIANSPPLVTSHKARLPDDNADRDRFAHLVPQYLHEPVTVKIEKFSAHPLEEDAKEVYLDTEEDYFEVTLDPEDGPYLLPYMARRADGTEEGTPFEPDDQSNPDIDFGGRQFFYPDASRIFEEIDRTLSGRANDGTGNILGEKADYDFVRPLPPAGYTKEGEVSGRDYFPYMPRQKAKYPRFGDLATIVNSVQHALDDGDYDGVIWLEGSTRLEETLYWLQLLLDTELPIVGHVANRRHGELSNDGDRNIVDGVDYIVSGKGDELGAVAIQDQLVYAAREFKKKDARPGGFTAVGGQGGVLGSIQEDVNIQYTPKYARTSSSDVNVNALPETVTFYDHHGDATESTFRIKDEDGLIGSMIPRVSIIKGSSYTQVDEAETPEREVDVIARIDQAVEEQSDDTGKSPKLHGLVFEGTSPYGSASPSVNEALHMAAFSGIPVVRVGRSDPGGFVPSNDKRPTIEGSNLDANKAVLLLMASLLKLGRLPKARDPINPEADERRAVMDKITQFQRLFDTH